VVPRFREVRELFTFEGGPGAPALRLREAASRWPGRTDFREASITSDGAEGLAAAARDADLVILLCFEALRFPGQRAALEQLQRGAAEKLAVVLIRSAFDASLIRPGVSVLDAGGYRDASLLAAWETLDGRLPVRTA